MATRATRVDGTHLGLAKEMGRGRSTCKACQDLVNHRARLWPPSMNNWMHNLSISRRKSSNEPEKERLHVCIVDLLISRCNFQCRDKSVNLDNLVSTKWFIPSLRGTCQDFPVPNVVEILEIELIRLETRQDSSFPILTRFENSKGRIQQFG